MKVFAVTVAAFLLTLAASPTFAEENAAPKENPPRTEAADHPSVPENNHADLKSEKMETRFDATKHMNICMKEKNDKKLCAKSAMAECMKSLSKAECRKAVRAPKK